MNVQLTIPDQVFSSEGGEAAREVVETVAAEGFRSGQLSTAQVRRLLGFETRFEVHEFLAMRGIPWVDYPIEDIEREAQLLAELKP